jgi:2-polyprenyl-6-hydroxyphenyl methylase/3-demethylubiquinone-9 3-methyltransferase
MRSISNKTVDPDEIALFSKMSQRWWDESGPFAPIHRITPVRMAYLKSVIAAHFGLDKAGLKAMAGLRILDIGCGGGLACEPLARLGADVTGIDADANAIAAAQAHAGAQGLTIDYHACASEDLVARGIKKFDVVLALEIVEHVSDVPAFVQSCVDLCRPGGLIVFSTLNRTVKSLLLAKIGAEYILRWVPAGTHDWRKFIRPSALADALARAGAEPFEMRGLVYNPIRNDFVISETDLDVNYFMAARKEK